MAQLKKRQRFLWIYAFGGLMPVARCEMLPFFATLLKDAESMLHDSGKQLADLLF